MKKLLSLLLAAATIFSLCACSQPEAPAETPSTTQPTTAPTEPTPTEPKPTEPEPNEPAPTEPSAISNDWRDFSFRLEGHVYRLPCDFSEFAENGWTLKYFYTDLPLEPYSSRADFMQKDGLQVQISLVNPGDQSKAPEDCLVDSISIYEGFYGHFDFEVAKGISVGCSSRKVLAAFGSATQEDWYGVDGDGSGEPTTIHMLRYETQRGYDQSMTFFFDENERLKDIDLLNHTLLPDDEPDDACQHHYSQTYVPPTCTEDGSITQICVDCNDIRIEIQKAIGHEYLNGVCANCGQKDPSVPAEVTYTVTVRSDKGKAVAGVIVSVYTDGEQPAATGITNEKGVATMTLLSAASYTIKLSRIPPGSSCKESYTSTSTRVNINLTTFSTVEPTDHSKANYKVGSVMGEFTLTDTDGNSYTLSDLLQNKKLIVLNFWFVNCGPCKEEFPYFQALHDKYAEDVQLLTLNHIDKKSDIIALREQSGYTFPMIAENIGLRQGFGMSMYPTTVLIGSNGKILRIITGSFLSEQDLIDTIQPFL